MSIFEVGNFRAVEYIWWRVLWAPAGCRVRRPPPVLVMFLLGVFWVGKSAVGGKVLGIVLVFGCRVGFLFFDWVVLYFR